MLLWLPARRAGDARPPSQCGCASSRLPAPPAPHLQHAVHIARVAKVLEAHRLAAVLREGRKAGSRGCTAEQREHKAWWGAATAANAGWSAAQCGQPQRCMQQRSRHADPAVASPGALAPPAPGALSLLGRAPACPAHRLPWPTSPAAGSRRGRAAGCTGSWGCRSCPASAGGENSMSNWLKDGMSLTMQQALRKQTNKQAKWSAAVTTAAALSATTPCTL